MSVCICTSVSYLSVDCSLISVFLSYSSKCQQYISPGPVLSYRPALLIRHMISIKGGAIGKDGKTSALPTYCCCLCASRCLVLHIIYVYCSIERGCGLPQELNTAELRFNLFVRVLKRKAVSRKTIDAGPMYNSICLGITQIERWIWNDSLTFQCYVSEMFPLWLTLPCLTSLNVRLLQMRITVFRTQN
jgi:hypothetical protein